MDEIKEHIRNGIKHAVKSSAQSTANAAFITEEQRQVLVRKQEEFFGLKSEKLTEEFIQRQLGYAAVEVHQAHLKQLKAIYQPINSTSDFFAEQRIRFFDITRWVADPEEKGTDKLVNVYHVLSGEECGIALIYHRSEESCRVTLAVANLDERNSDPTYVEMLCLRMEKALRGNFPGARTRKDENGELLKGDPLRTVMRPTNETPSVAIVSNIPSEKSADFVSQSMEKLLDGIVPQTASEEYTLVLLANPLQDHLARENRLCQLHSALTPYASYQQNYGYSENSGQTGSANIGASTGIGVGVGVSAGVTAHVDINFGLQFSRQSSVSAQVGKNEGFTQNYANYGVKHTQDLIEKQVKRIEESSALGMWEFAAYVISEDPVITNNVAHMYLALTQGEDSYLLRTAINLWIGQDKDECNAADTIVRAVRNLQHPVFTLQLSDDSIENESRLFYPVQTQATSILSGKELARALNFPRRAVSGFPVFECTAFGRNVTTLDDEGCGKEGCIELGKIFHMHRAEKAPVYLNQNELTAHTFITGSTGSGKSTTIYQLLSQLCRKGKHFLVIEPAKGEYKSIFGSRPDVSVYGTNPALTALLRLNPFRFPVESIHIYEHLDKLTEIFNVCWPMYAAMPAVLKAAMENAYRSAGWDLTRSVNPHGAIFPNFVDVAIEVEKYINRSEYSDENKSNYKGSLLTRLESLTNGLNGLIFSADDISDKDLFDKNVIIDLSRVGSSETKALIMGILILKLQEYRVSQQVEGNSQLKHITVLEEAHNLLKRTSTEQSSETANLLGKSVEMLANSIAEMRTYGEAFVIADQSPGLLDMSVIRNTNTKIIMRLPDFSDRELVGKSAGLNDDQIGELARLPRGVAAVYQSDWVNAVLCAIDKPHLKETPYISPSTYPAVPGDSLLFDLLDSGFREKVDMNRDEEELFRSAIIRSTAPTEVKVKLLDYLDNRETSAGIHMLSSLVFDHFKNAKEALEGTIESPSVDTLKMEILAKLEPSVMQYNDDQINALITLIISEYTNRYLIDYPVWREFAQRVSEGGIA